MFSLFFNMNNMFAQGSEEIYIAVMNLEGKAISQIEADALSDRLRSELFNSGKYKVIERDNMDKIMEEQAFQQSGCTSDECIVEMGEILGVEQIIVGSVSQIGKVISVAVRVIDVETGEVINIVNFDYKGSIDTLLKSGMKKVSLDIVLGKQKSMLMGRVTFETDKPVMVYIDGKEVDEAPFYEYMLTSGAHKIELKTKKGELLKREIVSFGADKITMYNISANSKGNTVLKSALLPGLGQFTTERYLSGSLYSAGFLAGVGTAVFGYMENSDNMSDYDKVKKEYDALSNGAEKIKLGEELNDLQVKCDESSTINMIGIGLVASVYVFNLVDSYFFTPAFSTDVIANNNNFNIKPKYALDLHDGKVEIGVVFNW